MKIAKIRSTNELRVEMLPLIDVVFLVLVAFIYASMFMTQKTGLAINLPVANTAQTQMSKVLILTIMRDRSLFLNKKPILLENLRNVLSSAKTSDGDRVLFIRADKEAQLFQLVQIMNIARQVDIKSLTIATEKIVK